MMNLEGTHTLSKTALAMIFMFGVCACLPDIEPQTQQDGGSGGGDTGPIDASSDLGADAEVDADASASCTDVPPEDCVAMEPGSYCGDDGVPFECSVTDSGCVIKTVLSCEDQEFCEDGSCKECDEVAGCTAVGDPTCTDSFEPAVCARDRTTGCFILDVADICPVSSFCEAGECRSCEALGNACDVDGTTRCDPDLVEGNLRTVEKCAEVNGCQVYVPDADLQCPLGETCAEEGLCESCHDPLCEVDGVVDASAAQCPDPAAPREIERCEVDLNGCFKETPSMCLESTYCATDSDGTSCVDCATVANSCDTMEATRCGGNDIEECGPDPATGCLVWSQTQLCVQASVSGGVCVPTGGLLDPVTGDVATAATCVANECLTVGVETCSANGDVQVCKSDPTTNLKYLDVIEDCSDKQSCKDEGSGLECICDHECDMGSEQCVDGRGATEASRVTKVCDDTRADSCRVWVTDTSNACNAGDVPDGGGVGCGMGASDIILCELDTADQCRRPVSNLCPCPVVCLDREECVRPTNPLDANYTNGTPRYICQ